MKKHLTFTLMVLLVSLMAFGAYAQSQGEPVKPQTQTQTKPADPIRERTDQGPQGKGTMTTDRTRTDEGPKKGSGSEDPADKASGEGGVKPQTQTQTKPEDPIRSRKDTGPQGDGTATTDRTRTDAGPKKGSSGDSGLADKASGDSGQQNQTQVKPEDPIRSRKDTGPQGDGTMTTDRTRTDAGPKKGSSGDSGLADKASGDSGQQNQTQTKPDDPIRTRKDTGPQGNGTMTTDRIRTDDGPKGDGSGGSGVADKADGECDGDQDRVRSRDGLEVDGHGGTNRHGDEINGLGGPHSNGQDDLADKADGGECDGDQTRTRGRDGFDVDGHGGTHRHGELITGLGGPHSNGLIDDMLKIFGEDTDGALRGMRNIWGPAEAGGGAFGPNVDGVGYGPGSAQTDDESKTDSVAASRGARRGRK